MVRDLGEARGRLFFYEREKLREAGEQDICSASLSLAGELAGRQLDSRRDAGATCGASAFEALVEAFLEAR